MNFGPKQKSYSAHVDLPKVLVHCKLTQFHTPRGSIVYSLRIFIRQLSLLREEFRLSKFTLHSDLRRPAASRLALPCTSSFLFISFSFYL